MIDWMIWITGWGLLLLAATQLFFVVAFAIRLKRWQPQDIPDEDCPQVAVVLSLRGNDPFLADTIRGLLKQDYPNYCLRFVVDHADDPAARIVDETLQDLDASAVSIRPLSNRLDSCSLLCSSVIQAVSELDEETEVVAFVDADVLPDPRWLRDLVLPLKDPGVSMTMGNRWFMPADNGWGTIVRYAFNAIAVLHMYWCGMIWGGSMAIKTDVLRNAGVAEKWKRALFHDSPIYQAILDHGFKPQFVPGLMMVNRESCGLVPLYRWMKRQLLNIWLYHPNWSKTGMHLVVAIIVISTGIAGAVVALLTGSWNALWFFITSLLLYSLALTAMVGIAEAAIRSIAPRREETAGWLSPTKILRLIVAVPISGFMTGFALASVPFTRRIEWRGVSYELRSRWNVRLVKYKAYRAEVAGSVASL